MRASLTNVQNGISGSAPDVLDRSPASPAEGTFHLGTAQVAVLWRLTKADLSARAIVMDDANGMRLVVVEGERVVQWERFQVASQLRTRAGAIQTQRRRDGWRNAARL